jgi:hypothetical protein
MPSTTATRRKTAVKKPVGKDIPASEVTTKSVRQNDLMAFIYFAHVEKTTARGEHGSPELTVKNVDTGTNFKVIGSDIIERALSADQYKSTKKISRTEMAEILITSYNRPFTVVFEKADGTMRTLRGRYVSHEKLMGRSRVEDLDKGRGEFRLVCHRTLQELIVGGIRYQIKK